MKNRVLLNSSNLKSAIARKKIRKSELAINIGISRETFSRWLAGRVDYVDERKLVILSRILECDLSWLSPEIIPKDPGDLSGFQKSDQIRGDDFVKMALVSGLWTETIRLYSYSRTTEIIENGLVNKSLVQALAALMSLDFSHSNQWLKSLEPLQKNHEVFDVIARYCMIDGIPALVSGEIAEAQKLFTRTVIQSQSDWLVGLAYLLSGICFILEDAVKEAIETWKQAVLTLPSSQDDLTVFVLANIHLSLCLFSVAKDHDYAESELLMARKQFDKIGYRFGAARCLSYEALLFAMQGNLEESTRKIQEASQFIQRMPRLYQYEAWMLIARVNQCNGRVDTCLQYFAMATEMDSQFNIFAFLAQKEILKLKPENMEIREKLDKFSRGKKMTSYKSNVRKTL